MILSGRYLQKGTIVQAYKNILIIKMSSLGDVLHALPVVYALRENCPGARIVWAVHPNFSAVLPGKPYIDDIVYIDKKRLKSPSYWAALRRTLHAYNFDLCLDLQGLAKSAVVAFLSGAKEKYGYWEMREGSFLVSKGLAGEHQYDHVIERYLDTVRVLDGKVTGIEFPLPSVETEKREMMSRLTAAGMTGAYVAIVPGARWQVKEWPLAYWEKLISCITDTGMNVVLLGSRDDVPKGKHIAEHTDSPRVFDWTGKTTLKELMAAISLSVLYISADTGPLHIANALKKELIALFGPTSPARTGPYGGVNCPYIHILTSPTSRATPEHPLIDDPECMAQLTADMVWDEYKSIMQEVQHD